jgi:hypothetical protein
MLNMIDTNDLEKTRQLLKEVYPDALKFDDQKFLYWEYFLSPNGLVIQKNLDQESNRIGHYALVPQRWILDGEELNVALSLNTAISKPQRLKGQFKKLAEATFSAAESRGIDAIVGVANKNSTWAFVNRLGFTNLGALETRVIFRKEFSKPALAERISKSDLANFIQSNQGSFDVENGFHRVWDDQEINWRLASPSTSFDSFSLQNALIISTASKFKGVAVSVILKIFAPRESPSLSMQKIVNETCKLQNTSLAIYSGINPSVCSAGIFIPNWLRPAPLNLIIKPLSPKIDLRGRTPTTFEFLDFDAY